MIVHSEIIQGTPEWDALRCGRFTASTFGDLFMKESTNGYQNAINKVVFERMSGESPESFTSQFMERGTALEPLARQSYELTTFNKIQQVGFIEHDEWIGGSPDGLIGKDGTLEMKCPKWNTLIGYLLNDEIPKEYAYQMQGNLFVSERLWCDFWVWHPKFQPMLRRVERDEKMITEIQEKLKVAIKEAEQRIKLLKRVA
jgi:putative phage-type endonuclease